MVKIKNKKGGDPDLYIRHSTELIKIKHFFKKVSLIVFLCGLLAFFIYAITIYWLNNTQATMYSHLVVIFIFLKEFIFHAIIAIVLERTGLYFFKKE